MDVNVLGPMEVSVRGPSTLPTAGKPRQVLALLALRGDTLVTVATLMEEIWGERPPRSAATTLQTYILQLRRFIATELHPGGAVDPKKVLATRPGGYVLAIAPGSVDADRFEQLAARGRRACADGDPAAGSELLRRALALWRGPALIDVGPGPGPVLELEAMALEEARMVALEQRIEADLRLGRHAEILIELMRLARRYRLNENVHRLLMAAFALRGDVIRALETYQTLRRSLREELGIEPSDRIRRLHRAILAGEPLVGADVVAAQPAF